MSVIETGGVLLEERPARLLAEECQDPDVHAENFVRLAGGASRQTWSVETVTASGGHHELILRRDPPGIERPGGMAKEAVAMQAAMGAGVLEPEILLWGDGEGTVGSPLVLMRRVEGETLARRILREPVNANPRSVSAKQSGEALARIHGTDPRVVPGLEATRSLEALTTNLVSLAEPHPVLELGVRWLRANNRPVAHRRQAVVHGDFRNVCSVELAAIGRRTCEQE